VTDRLDALPAYSPARARRATGLLREFNANGLLAAADVHVALALGRLGGEADEAVLLAAALTVRGTRAGSVVLDLATAADTVGPEALLEGGGMDDGDDPTTAEPPWPEREDWRRRCAASPLVAGADGPAGRPLRLVGSSMWLDRYWTQERQVADDLLARVDGARPGVDLDRLRAGLARLFPEPDDADQRLAAAVCVLSRLTVVAGGPGTGKTTTVARLLALLRDQPGPAPRIALAAPTGKAAARLAEAVQAAALRLEPADRERVGSPAASTLHRLLGWKPGASGRFLHDRSNRLPHDVVVVDETSMVSLTLMARLLEALRPSARLVLVGDPDQLASVEAGAVLGDLVGPARVPSHSAEFRALLATVVEHPSLRSAAPADDVDAAGGRRLRDAVVVLDRTRRFAEHGAIADLARAVRDGDPDAVLELLRAGAEGVEFLEVEDDALLSDLAVAGLRADVTGADAALREAALRGDAPAALAALERHRLLCAHRVGPRGVRAWTDRIAGWLGPVGDVVRSDGRYLGEPLLVTANDHEAGLFNGDTGVIVAGPGGEAVAAFRRGGGHRLVPLGRLPDVRPLHAMTVHRSQGSEFRRVSLLLPPAGSPLATRQTLYTALTRAGDGVRVIGSAAAVEQSVSRPAARASGLHGRLA
jgi:exodeoxyribonuclease V alpha subunit